MQTITVNNYRKLLYAGPATPDAMRTIDLLRNAINTGGGIVELDSRRWRIISSRIGLMALPEGVSIEADLLAIDSAPQIVE